LFNYEVGLKREGVLSSASEISILVKVSFWVAIRW